MATGVLSPSTDYVVVVAVVTAAAAAVSVAVVGMSEGHSQTFHGTLFLER
jgi:hypothetical protein